MPYAPKDTKIKGNINFDMLKTRSFIKTNLAFLNATNTDAINTKKRLKTTNITNEIPKILYFKNINFGKKMSIFKTKIKLIMQAKMPAKEKQELIISFFLLKLGRYLINEISKPSKDKETNNPAEANKVEANPICSEENNLVLIAQKKNPRPVIVIELAINHRVFPYR